MPRSSPSVTLVAREEYLFVARDGTGWAFVLLDLLSPISPRGTDHRLPVLLCEADLDEDETPTLEGGG